MKQEAVVACMLKKRKKRKLHKKTTRIHDRDSNRIHHECMHFTADLFCLVSLY